MHALNYCANRMQSSLLGLLRYGLKAQKHIAQGKRSDTLGQSTFVSDAL